MRNIDSNIPKPGIRRTIVKLLAIVIIFELIVLVIVGMIGWRKNWSTIDEYTQALQLFGMLIIGLGLFSIKGNWDAARSFEYQYSLSVTDQNILKRTQQTLIDFAESYRFMIVMLLVGVISILIGWLL